MRRFILSTRINILTILIGTFGGLALVLVIAITGFGPTPVYPYYPTPIYLVILLLPALSGALIGYAWDRSRSKRLSRDTESRRAAGFEKLPVSVTGFIAEVINKMRYRRGVRRDVELELIYYFNDATSDCQTSREKDTLAQTLIEQFGDPKLLAQLIRRAKKRCRPLWKKTLIRTAQATAALLLFCCLYTWWFLTGKPNVTIDYVERLNQVANPQATDDQNAWPYYQKAIDQLLEPDEIIEKVAYNTNQWQKHASLSSAQQKAIDDWINRNENAWGEYFAAGKMKHFWFDYKSRFTDQDDHMVIAVRLSPLGAMKALSRLGIWKARLHIEKGDIHNGLDHCLSIVRTGRHLQAAPIIIEQLVGLSISHMGHREILHMVSDAKLTASQLTHVQNQLTAVYQNQYPVLNLAFERLVHLDTVQWYFTDSGPGGGHMLPNVTQIIGSSDLPIPVPMISAGRHDTLKAFNILDDMFEKEIHLTPWQIHTTTDTTAKDYLNSLPKFRYMLVHELVPTVNRASELVWRGRALHEATLTILALHRWKLQKGSYPDSLEELIDTGLLERLPLDPYSDRPLTYKKQGDDFILYSYAGDFDDDQGRQNADRPWADREEDGDRLFWPLETPDPTSTDL
ncbi:MAG: hypothetical protein IID32_10540 [Planctomycetes bacterium]|nr:hypothetical protein [Planctomycetota bacterium]